MTQTTTGAASRRPRVSRDFLEHHRRRRLIHAAAEILHEFGGSGLTVANVVQVAGVARNSFYEVFGGLEDLISYATGVASEELFAGLADEPSGSEWLIEVHEAIASFYGRVADEPLLAELLLIHASSPRAGGGSDAFWAAGARFVPLIRHGEAQSVLAHRRPPTKAIAECISRSIVALAASRIQQQSVETLQSEARSMALLVGVHYLSPEMSEGKLAAATGG
jgi:AcrR family transcriptional regulator